MEVLCDEVLVMVLGHLSVPADFARCACVSHRWQTLCRAARPCHIDFHWRCDRRELPQRQILWMCDRLRQGGLVNVTSLTFVGQDFEDDTHQRDIGNMFTIMRCLPLHSCTFNSSAVGTDIYQYLPDTVRRLQTKHMITPLP